MGDELDEDLCESMRDARTELRNVQTSVRTALRRAARDMGVEEDNMAAEEALEVLANESDGDFQNQEDMIVDLIRRFCDEGPRERSAAVEAMTP